jgi:hypothetical protein
MDIYFIKSALEKKVGFRVDTISACRKLERILKMEGTYVSYTTLSRIFGIASFSSQARESTLNELSRFLGFEDAAHLITHHNDQNALNQVKIASRLELEALLLQQQGVKAIDYLMSLKTDYPSVFRYNSQFVCKYLFDKTDRSSYDIQHLLSYTESTFEILQHFVYEDDPHAHFSRTLAELSKLKTQDHDLYVFYQLFDTRKKLLRGERIEEDLADLPLVHYHSESRMDEINLLSRRLSMQKITERTEEILNEISHSNDLDEQFARIGRWCRGLLLTSNEQVLKSNASWKAKCIELIHRNVFNIEFQVIISVFLMRVYHYEPPLNFMFKSTWENAKIESQMLLALGFNKSGAFNTFKGFLGYK